MIGLGGGPAGGLPRRGAKGVILGRRLQPLAPVLLQLILVQKLLDGLGRRRGPRIPRAPEGRGRPPLLGAGRVVVARAETPCEGAMESAPALLVLDFLHRGADERVTPVQALLVGNSHHFQ